LRKLALGLLCALAACPALAGTQGKKLVEYGWDAPSTAYVRKYVKEMEKIPFDGVIIRVAKKDQDLMNPTSLAWESFSKKRLQPQDYQHAIDDLKATKFTRFTDNFIQLISAPGDVDWFDPEWSAIAHNAACFAKVAKQTHCVGIMFDPEMYTNYKLWGYKLLPRQNQAAHSFDQYRAKVRQRGREFIRSINNEFPDITILCLYGMSMPYVQSRAYVKTDLINTDYSLLASFYDGICEAATPKTTLVDGYEWSYGYRTRQQFVEGRARILTGSKELSAVPKAFTRHTRAGFGLWADWNSAAVPWNQQDYTKNYFTPAGFRASLNYAMETSDRYVWVYSERFRWWGDTPPLDYAEAMRLAKSGPGPGEPHPLQYGAAIPHAADLPGYSDSETFAEMKKTMTEVYDLPKDGWKFRRDGTNYGAKRGWQLPSTDDSTWKDIAIGRFWEEQGEDYDGRAWYRRSFAAPAIQPGKRIFLAFGAADESARVWLNGSFIGEHNIIGGWDKPFSMEVTRQIKPGKDNFLAVQVLDRVNAGGLWKSVKLMVK
jgi:hypothetical protein